MSEAKATAPRPWRIDKERGEIIDANGDVALYLPVEEWANDFATGSLILEAVNSYDSLLARIKKLIEALTATQEAICMMHCQTSRLEGKHVKVCHQARAALAENKEQAGQK
jgi:hypothetical protein